MNPILAAARFAEEAHRGQRRMFGGRPYIVHPGRVAARLMRHPDATEPLVCAAWLHDVVEDCGVAPREIHRRFGEETLALVLAVTSPTQTDPELRELSRRERARIEREHLADAPREARMLKLADRADNLGDLSPAAARWLRKYVPESELLLDTLRGTDRTLEDELAESIERARSFVERYQRP